MSKTVKKSDNGYKAEVTKYLYDRQHVILETDAAASIKARYVRGINYIARTDSADKLSYFLFNGHGDVVQTVDEAGTVQNNYDYDIWGNPILTVEIYSNSIRYAGEFLDVETGLYYLRARYYDSYIGRFVSEDSYWGEDSNPLSLNLYTYCENDPINFVDPSGHEPRPNGGRRTPEAPIAGIGTGLAAGAAAGAAITDAIFASSNSNSSSSISSPSRAASQGTTTITYEGTIFDVPNSELDYWLSCGCEVFDGAAYGWEMENYSDIDEINTPEGSSIAITNHEDSSIDTINTGTGSVTIVNNEGKITTINAGSESRITVNNSAGVLNYK